MKNINGTKNYVDDKSHSVTIKSDMDIKADTLRYAMYLRKSSEAKEKQALSIKDQKSECENEALRSNIRVMQKFEESRSAYKPNNRPEFDKLLSLIKEARLNAILCWKPDRLCRNPEEGGKLLQMLQDGVLKQIKCATGEVYTPESDHLILQIHFGMANQYSRNLSQNVRRGLLHKCERGQYPRPACIGYESYGLIGQRLMRPHPSEAPLILELYELASTGGMSLNQLREKMTGKGLVTKRGNKLSKSHIYNILTCPTYYGYFYHNGEFFEGEYEPIISKALFDTVQDALRKRSKPKVKAWESTFNGLITCADCGCQITTTIKTKYYKKTDRYATYTYHHCTHRKGNCNQEAITGLRLKNLLIDNAESIAIDEEAWQLGIELFKAKHKEYSDKLTKRLRYLQSQFTAIRNQITALVKMRANQELTQEEFMEQKAELLAQKKDIEEKLNDNNGSADTWLELCTKYLNNAFEAKEVMESDDNEAKRNLILDVGKNLTLKDQKLDFTFKEPYDVLLKPEYRTNMLALVDYVGTYYERQLMQSQYSYYSLYAN